MISDDMTAELKARGDARLSAALDACRAEGAPVVSAARALIAAAPRDALVAIARDALRNAAAPAACATFCEAALRSGDAAAATALIFEALERLRPPALRQAKMSGPFVRLIETARAAGRADLATCLSLVLRDRITAPADLRIYEASPRHLRTRRAFMAAGRAAAAMGAAPWARELRFAFAGAHPYYQDPVAAPKRRALLLNWLPDLGAAEERFVHNQSNFMLAYDLGGPHPDLALDTLYLAGADEAAPPAVRRPDVIINNIGGAEFIGRRKLGPLITRIAEALGAPLLNPPDKVLSTARDANFTRGGDDGRVIFPRTRRFAKGADPRAVAGDVADEFAWPVIMRDAEQHMGRSMRLVASATEAREAAAALNARDFYAIQWMDFSDAEGVWEKFRALMIGGELIPATTHCDTQWNVHLSGHEALRRSRPDLGLEARRAAYVVNPTSVVPADVWHGVAAALAATGLDVVGADFAVLPDGRGLIFEMNASMRGTRWRGRAAIERLLGLEIIGDKAETADDAPAPGEDRA